MNVTIYLLDETVHHTNVDRVFETSSFLCLSEGSILYRYSISRINKVIENSKYDEEKDV